MSARNGTGTVADPGPVDDAEANSRDAAAEPRRPDRAKAAAEREEHKLDAAVRRVGERARARRAGHDPSIRITRVDPASLAPTSSDDPACGNCGLPFQPGEGRRRDGTHGAPVHANGGCERARRRAAVPETDSAADPATSPANGSSTPPPASDAAEQLVGAWRDQVIVDWLRAEGPKTAREIATRFAIGQPQDAITRLRTRGLIEKTGVKRLAAGIKSGRPGAEYRATETQPRGCEPSAVRKDPVPGPKRELQVGSAARDTVAPPQESRPESEHAGGPVGDPAPHEPLTMREQLAVRYIAALVNSIDRASILRGDPPPMHVYDRIERLLAIQDTAA